MSIDYAKLGSEVGELVAEKQRQYGDSIAKAERIMAILYPDGVPASALSGALTVIRVLDKLARIATAAGGPDMGGESPWRDIAGYALLELGKPASECVQFVPKDPDDPVCHECSEDSVYSDVPCPPSCPRSMVRR